MQQQEEEEEEDDDWEGYAEPEPEPTRDLFSERVFDSAAECLEHAAKEHGLDLSAIASCLKLDIYGRVKLVNYVRKNLIDQLYPEAVVAVVKQAAETDNPPWNDDKYLMPAIPDDPLLYSLGSPMGGDDVFGDDSELPGGIGGADAEEQSGLLLETIQQMRTEMASLLGLNEGTDGAPSSGMAADPPAGAGIGEGGARSLGGRGTAGSDLPAPPPPEPTHSAAAGGGATEGEYGSTEGPESKYFASYARLGIHEEMLTDHVRTQGYKDAIEGLGPLLAGKAVLDVGCGTAILSMISARAGASRVVGVDASDIIGFAQRIVQANKLDGQVSLLRGTMETLAMPADVPHVDIIVSEWMGYALLYESMLPTVLYARDKYLKPGGLMLPSACDLCLAAGSHDRLSYWADVYGFQMDAIATELIKEASVEVVPGDTLLTPAATFATIDVMTTTDKALDFAAAYKLVVATAGTVRCFVLHFDTIFDCTAVGGKRTSFTTSCEATSTHWKQTALYLKEPMQVQPGDVLTGNAHFARDSDYKRAYNIALDIELNGTHKATQCWTMK